MPRVILYKARDRIGVYDFSEHQKCILIGRGETLDIPVLDPMVSRMHAQIVLQGGLYLLQDIGSQNGVFIGKERIESVPLGDETTFTIGLHDIIFQRRPGDDPELETEALKSRLLKYQSGGAHLEQTMPFASPPPMSGGKEPLLTDLRGTRPVAEDRLRVMQNEMARKRDAYLERLDGDLVCSRVPLTGTRVLFGRGPGADVDVGGHWPVPDAQAVLDLREDGYWLTPLSKLRVIQVNGVAVKAPCPVQDGDRIQIGTIVFGFHARVEVPG